MSGLDSNQTKVQATCQIRSQCETETRVCYTPASLTMGGGSGGRGGGGGSRNHRSTTSDVFPAWCKVIAEIPLHDAADLFFHAAPDIWTEVRKQDITELQKVCGYWVMGSLAPNRKLTNRSKTIMAQSILFEHAKRKYPLRGVPPEAMVAMVYKDLISTCTTNFPGVALGAL